MGIVNVTWNDVTSVFAKAEAKALKYQEQQQKKASIIADNILKLDEMRADAQTSLNIAVDEQRKAEDFIEKVRTFL